jgi:hypothetical protein
MFISGSGDCFSLGRYLGIKLDNLIMTTLLGVHLLLKENLRHGQDVGKYLTDM